TCTARRLPWLPTPEGPTVRISASSVICVDGAWSKRQPSPGNLQTTASHSVYGSDMSGWSMSRRGLFRRLIQRTTSQMAIAPGHVRMIVADADGKRKAMAQDVARQKTIGRHDP